LGESIDEERNEESCKAREEEGCSEEKEVAQRRPDKGLRQKFSESAPGFRGRVYFAAFF
jgi:hypothetical protein